MKSTKSRLCIGWMVLCWKGIVIGWKRLESTKLGLVHTSVMDSEAAGVSQIGTRCPTVWPQIAFQNRSHHVLERVCMLSIHPDEPDENIGLWRMVLGSEWRENKSSSGILFSFKLTFTSIFWACIQLNDSSPYSFSLLNPGFHFLEKIWRWWGEGGQGKDKAATSQTLKLCQKRKEGKGGFLHLRNYDTEKQKQKGFKIVHCKIPRSPITGCVFYLSHLPSKRNSKYVAALALVTHECKLNWCSLIGRMKEYQFPMIYYVAPGPGLSHMSQEA